MPKFLPLLVPIKQAATVVIKGANFVVFEKAGIAYEKVVAELTAARQTAGVVVKPRLDALVQQTHGVSIVTAPFKSLAVTRHAVGIKNVIGRLVAENDPLVTGIQYRLAEILQRSRLHPVFGYSNSSSGTVKPPQNSGVSHSIRASGTSKAILSDGISVIEEFYSVVSRPVGAVTEYEVDGENGDWDNATAASDKNAGTEAEMSGGKGFASLSPKEGGLRIAFADLTNKGALTITDARITFQMDQAGTALGNGTLAYGWIKNGVEQSRTELSGNGEYTPEIDLTALASGDWSYFDDVEAYVEASSAALGRNVRVQEVQLVVTGEGRFDLA